MATPQTGIFALGTMSHAYLELDVRPGADPRELVRLVASLREPRTTIGGVNLVAGFRPELWASVAPDTSPSGLKGFSEPIVGADGYTLQATQHDVVVWLAGAAYDVVFDLSRGVVAALAAHATLGHEMVGWPYHRDLDLTGFVDGLENPTLVEATTAAIVEQGAPGEGGSVLLLQQWEHDADRWESLPAAQQEQVMGRRKVGGDELDPRPETSHVARTDQEQFGRIFRRNIGYGTLTRHGTIFVGFSQDRERLDAMLDSMTGRGGSHRDRLTDLTRALTGSYYFRSLERSARDVRGRAHELRRARQAATALRPRSCGVRAWQSAEPSPKGGNPPSARDFVPSRHDSSPRVAFQRPDPDSDPVLPSTKHDGSLPGLVADRQEYARAPTRQASSHRPA